MYLKCSDIEFKYKESEKKVIENLTFSMDSPGFNAIFGPSGVGKTSLAKILTNPPVYLRDNIETQDIKNILYTYNLERLPGWSSIGGHLDKVTDPVKEELKKHLVEVCNLQPLLKSRFTKLSAGQQNRINLIRYLVQDFDLLIMDESLANVDEILRGKIILDIKNLFPEKMFLYISHNLMEVSKFCKDILVFGKPSRQKKGFIIKGQNLENGKALSKAGLDKTMLEIMNAF